MAKKIYESSPSAWCFAETDTSEMASKDPQLLSTISSQCKISLPLSSSVASEKQRGLPAMVSPKQKESEAPSHRRCSGSQATGQFLWAFIDLDHGRELQSGWRGDYAAAWSHANDLANEHRHPVRLEADGQPEIVDVTVAAVFPKDDFEDSA